MTARMEDTTATGAEGPAVPHLASASPSIRLRATQAEGSSETARRPEQPAQRRSTGALLAMVLISTGTAMGLAASRTGADDEV